MNELIIENKLIPSAERKLAHFEQMVKEIKKAEDELKASIKAEMEARGIRKLEGDELTITYIAPTDAEKFDKARFRKEHPDLHDEYIRMTPVAGYIKIALKEEER